MGLAGQQMRSSFTDSHQGKINPDLWLSNRGERLSVTTRLHQDRWLETLVFDKDVPSESKVTSIILDRQTGQIGHGVDQYQTTATQRAKIMVGMP